MGWKAAITIVVVLIASVYALAMQDPIFLAKFGALLHSGGSGHVQVSGYLYTSPQSPWQTSGFGYACGSMGPGILAISNTGSSNSSVTGVSLTYGGMTFNATGPACTAAPGSSSVSIVSIAGAPPPKGTAFSGYIAMADGNRVSFSGDWA